MKIDWSKLLYDKYFNLTDRFITVTLKNGVIISGFFIAFRCGNRLSSDSFITQWQLVSEADKNTLGIDPAGFFLGQFVQQKDILEINFHQDNSIMHFE